MTVSTLELILLFEKWKQEDINVCATLTLQPERGFSAFSTCFGKLWLDKEGATFGIWDDERCALLCQLAWEHCVYSRGEDLEKGTFEHFGFVETEIEELIVLRNIDGSTLQLFTTVQDYRGLFIA